MNKFGIVVGVAAVAALAGCKNPDYPRASGPSVQGEVKNADTTVLTPIAIESTDKTCTCPPGIKHDKPCKCGASDCKCAVVEKAPVAVANLSTPPAPVEPETTEYIVQDGDYLAKISKKFNVTIASIKRLNPSIKKDIVRVGQKIRLPGKIDVGVQEAPKQAAPKAATAKTCAPYTGATKEYVVKGGDTLGAIAYGNGINIRQLKELNGLSSDMLKAGQKLRIPAEKATPEKPVAGAPKKTVVPVVAEKKIVVQEPKQQQVKVEEPVVETPVEEKKDTDAYSPIEEKRPDTAAPELPTYMIQEGDDMIGVSLRWGVTAAEIRELNNMSENDKLVPGQVIRLPAEAQQ